MNSCGANVLSYISTALYVLRNSNLAHLLTFLVISNGCGRLAIALCQLQKLLYQPLTSSISIMDWPACWTVVFERLYANNCHYGLKQCITRWLKSFQSRPLFEQIVVMSCVEDDRVKTFWWFAFNPFQISNVSFVSPLSLTFFLAVQVQISTTIFLHFLT